jgi:hypothetical protein
MKSLRALRGRPGPNLGYRPGGKPARQRWERRQAHRFGLSSQGQGMINSGVRFPVREQARALPVWSQAVAGQVSGELDAVYLRASSGSRRARPGYGTRASHVQRLPRPVQTDSVLRASARHRPSAADWLDIKRPTVFTESARGASCGQLP